MIGLVVISTVTHTIRVLDMKYTKEQLIDALVHEWDYLCHDDYDPGDLTSEEYRKDMEELTIEQLIEQTSTDEIYTLDEFMENHG